MEFENFEIKTDNVNLTDEQFFNLCQDNESLRFERTSNGQILVMTPSGIDTSSQNLDIATLLKIWNFKYKLGKVFGCDAGFTFPNNAVRSPDCSFIYNEKVEKLSKHERERFAHVVPDFVVELMSPSDNLKYHRDKMEEYISNGVLLGWLINPKTEEVYIYRPDGKIEFIKGFDKTLSGETVLPEFEFELCVLR